MPLYLTQRFAFGTKNRAVVGTTAFDPASRSQFDRELDGLSPNGDLWILDQAGAQRESANRTDPKNEIKL